MLDKTRNFPLGRELARGFETLLNSANGGEGQIALATRFRIEGR
jgi:hypothetical protein